MKNKKIFRLLALAAALLMLVGNALPLTASSYRTYTFSKTGEKVDSPEAYTAERTYHAADMNLTAKGSSADVLDEPTDIVVDDDGNVYIADSGNNRILVLDSYFKFRFEIAEYVNEHGVSDALENPNGVFVTGDTIYVADTNNSRIVAFDKQGEFLRTLEEPSSEVFPEGSIYKPIAVAVDKADRLYVVSSSTYMGIIVLNPNGDFQSFIGAPKVAVDPLELLWRSFMSAKEKAESTQYVSTEYNNITIDEYGFIYVTTTTVDEAKQLESISDKSADYAPVKKLNTAGNDVMARNGFYGPCGEVVTGKFSANAVTTDADGKVSAAAASRVSKIVDVACGPEESWSILDSSRQTIYTYDNNGDLLFAFGGTGAQLGNTTNAVGLTYQGDKLLVLDRQDQSITVFNRTEYGDLLIAALRNNNERNYDTAVDDWQNILQRNGNFDAAYIGIGKALYRGGDWKTAKEYFKLASDIDSYSLTFKMQRKEWVSKYVLLIPVIVVALCIGLTKFFGYAGKVNKKATLRGNRKLTFKEEFMYVFHVMVHPFDGFWDLKHEKRGSVRAATVIMLLAVASFTYQAIGESFIFTATDAKGTSVFMQLLSIVVPLILWVTANWCLTTLFEGEGSFRDVYVATCYSLMPLVLTIIPATLITHILTKDESGIYSLILTIGWIWVGLLIFFGTMVTHDYSLGKNFLTCIGTIVGMAFIMFIGILFSTLIGRVISFIASVVQEISYRF